MHVNLLGAIVSLTFYEFISLRFSAAKLKCHNSSSRMENVSHHSHLVFFEPLACSSFLLCGGDISCVLSSKRESVGSDHRSIQPATQIPPQLFFNRFLKSLRCREQRNDLKCTKKKGIAAQ
ncbi:hypothetical protein Ddc_09238 [Ditylenchus destructor]|nr:hypothetical protein Ddc_09238 [Ditylenchus destructor]